MLNRAEVRKKLEEKGMSQAALGEAVGVSQAMIGYVLAGVKRPTLELTVGIARALGCTVDELIESEVG